MQSAKPLEAHLPCPAPPWGCPPHQLTRPRLATVAPRPQVDSPAGISHACQQIHAVAQEVVVAPIKGMEVKA